MLPRDCVREVLVILTRVVAEEVAAKFQWLRTEWEVRWLFLILKYPPTFPKLENPLPLAFE